MQFFLIYMQPKSFFAFAPGFDIFFQLFMIEWLQKLLRRTVVLEIKIYIDVLLLFNLLINYLLLWLTGLLLRCRLKTARVLAAAFLGAVYAVLTFFWEAPAVYSLAGKAAVGALMEAIAFRPRCLKAWGRYTAVFYSIVLLTGGAAYALLYCSGAGAFMGAVYRNGSFYINLPVYLLVFLLLFCYFLLHTALNLGARLTAAGKQVVSLRVQLGDESVRLRAFYDSGNFLSDRRGRGVILAEWKSLRPLFHGVKTPERVPVHTVKIACRSLSGQTELKAFLPDAVYQEGKRRQISVAPVYIGMVQEPLDFYNNWDAILPRDFEGVAHYEA